MCRYTLPLSELGGDFYDELKSVSSDYASFDYEEADYRSVSASLSSCHMQLVQDAHLHKYVDVLEASITYEALVTFMMIIKK